MKYYSKAEVEAYLRSKGDERVVSCQPSGWDTERKIYDMCAQIPGCKVGFVWDDPYINKPRAFIRWKGTEMCFLGYSNKTRSLCLIDRLETYGYNIYESNNKDNKPNDIGTPTAKKLDDWRTYLLACRKANVDNVARIVRMVENKKQMCKAMFPDGKETKYEYSRTEWHFSCERAGLVYTCDIHNNGCINEDLKLAYGSYNQHEEDTLTKAFLMMQNPYTPLKKEVV